MGQADEIAELRRQLDSANAARREAQKLAQQLKEQVDSTLLLKKAVEVSTIRAESLKTVDLCFVIDCTGSMSKYIRSVRRKIREVANFITAKMGTGASIRFAIVGYRDFDDDEHPVVLDFTTNTVECEQFLAGTRAYGGGDICEDVLGGLEAASKLSWQGKHRILFLISQTPNHGRRFHDFPAELTSGVPPEMLFDLHRDTDRQWAFTDNLLAKLRSMDVRLVCLELGHTTQKMFDAFAGAYDDEKAGFKLVVEPMGSDPKSFYEAVSRSSWTSITSSLTATASRLGDAAKTREPLRLNVDPSPIRWDNTTSWRQMHVKVSSYTANGVGKELKVDTTKRTMRLAPTPFAKGGMRYAFALFDETNGTKLVAKVYVFQDVELQSLKVFEGDMRTQVYAQQMADDWSRRLPDNPLQFVQAQLMTCPADAPFELMAIEPFIPGSYEKHTNNASYVRPDSELAQTFSHFTWHSSGGKLMVTDIQGVRTTLTDPQIHADDDDCFGRGNLGTTGMDAFFLNHRCGELCKTMNLKESPVQLRESHAVPEWSAAEDSDSDPQANKSDSDEHRDSGSDSSDGVLAKILGSSVARAVKKASSFGRGISRDASRAMSCAPAEQDPETGKGRDWIGCIQLAWTSPPVVRKVKAGMQRSSTRKVDPGDCLVEVDGKSVNDLDRGEILRMLSKHTQLSFRPAHACSFQDAIREAASKALASPPQEDDPASGQGRDWIGGIQLAWTSPPVVRKVKAGVNKNFPRNVEPGDRLVEVDDKSVNDLDRGQILRMLAEHTQLSFRPAQACSFQEAVREAASKALASPPQEDDPASGRGRDWIGGIQLAWTSPPTVRAVKPEVQRVFQHPISRGDKLDTIACAGGPRRSVAGLDRREILEHLAKSDGWGFSSSAHSDFENRLRDEALKALSAAPAEEDPASGKGRDWLGGILFAWTSPPVVRGVKPEAQKAFQRPINNGDVLDSVDGTDVANLNRREILQLLASFDEISFKSSKGNRFVQELRSAAWRALECKSVKVADWLGGIQLEWTSPPVVRQVKPEVQQHFGRPICPGDLLDSVDDREVAGLGRKEILQRLSDATTLGFKCSRDLHGKASGATGGLFDLLRGLKLAGDNFQQSVRESARRAMSSPPEEEDRASGNGRDWIGGIQFAWTSPPVVRAVKDHVHKSFNHPIAPGDILNKVDGVPVAGCTRREVLARLSTSMVLSFASSEAFGFRDGIRQAAAEAMSSPPAEDDAASGKGKDWIGGFQFAWTSPPVVRAVKAEVNRYFERPIKPGDTLHTIDNEDIEGLGRREILKRLSKSSHWGFGSSPAHRVQEAMREAAVKALSSPPQEKDPASGKGRDWIGGFLFAWTSPPVLRAVKPEVQECFPRKVTPGDTLALIDGKSVAGLGRREILERLREHQDFGFQDHRATEAAEAAMRDLFAGHFGDSDLSKLLSGPIRFRDGIRQAAAEAMSSPPAEEDAASGKGKDWIGGFQFAWTSPPVVRAVKAEVSQYFEKPIKPGDTLHTIDKEDIKGLGRREILKRLSTSSHWGFGSSPAHRVQEAMREAAVKALSSPPQEKDPASGKGRDWIGGFLFAWTSPPVVRAVKPEVQECFPRKVTPGDTLAIIDGKSVDGLGRQEILERLRDHKNFSFHDHRAAEAAEAAVRGLLARHLGGILGGASLDGDSDLSRLLSGHASGLLDSHIQEALRGHTSEHQTQTAKSLRVVDVAEHRATVTWEASHKPSKCSWCVEIVDSNGDVVFKTESNGLRCDVSGLKGATEYTARVAARGGGGSTPRGAATAKFRTMAPPDAPSFEFLCDGKCGTMVKLASGQEYLKLRSELGVFCVPCRTKVDETMREVPCANAAGGCRRRVRYSEFALACRGAEAPTRCEECEEDAEYSIA